MSPTYRPTSSTSFLAGSGALISALLLASTSSGPVTAQPVAAWQPPSDARPQPTSPIGTQLIQPVAARQPLDEQQLQQRTESMHALASGLSQQSGRQDPTQAASSSTVHSRTALLRGLAERLVFIGVLAILAMMLHGSGRSSNVGDRTPPMWGPELED